MPNQKGKPWKWSDVWASVANVERPKDGTDSPAEVNGGPRIPTEEEYRAWVDSRPVEGRPENIRMALRDRNPARWRRLQLDVKWMKNELRKMGLNPDDARWYL